MRMSAPTCMQCAQLHGGLAAVVAERELVRQEEARRRREEDERIARAKVLGLRARGHRYRVKAPG